MEFSKPSFLLTIDGKYNLYRLHLLVNTEQTVYAVYMPAKGKTPLNLNIAPDLLARVDKFRFKRMIATRTEAIELLLSAGLKANPEKPAAEKAAKAAE